MVRRRWTRLSDEALMQVRLRDLGLRIEGTPLARRLRILVRELERKGLHFRPHAWLSSSWFTPDGVAGFAIPFWLAHPRLTELEREHFGRVEGETEEECLRLMRHETGHTVLNAYGLHRRRGWRERFGLASTPYRWTYRPRPRSKAFVHNLGGWYAQSHPVEDFCETFAVWLRRGRAWRRKYSGTPALEKLLYVEEEMQRIADQRPRLLVRERTESLRTLPQTLAQYYRARLRGHEVLDREPEDATLGRLFLRRGGSTLARDWLARRRNGLLRETHRESGYDVYAIDQVLEAWIRRSHALGLRAASGRPERSRAVRVLARAVGELVNGRRIMEYDR